MLPVRDRFVAFPRRQQGSALGWILGLLAVGALLIALIVIGLLMMGWSLFTEQAQTALQQQPDVAEHIGHIQSMDVDLVASSEYDDSDTFVFRLSGDRGKGRVRARFISTDADTETLGEGELTLASGRVIRFGPNDPPKSDIDK